MSAHWLALPSAQAAPSTLSAAVKPDPRRWKPGGTEALSPSASTTVRESDFTGGRHGSPLAPGAWTAPDLTFFPSAGQEQVPVLLGAAPLAQGSSIPNALFGYHLQKQQHVQALDKIAYGISHSLFQQQQRPFAHVPPAHLQLNSQASNGPYQPRPAPSLQPSHSSQSFLPHTSYNNGHHPQGFLPAIALSSDLVSSSSTATQSANEFLPSNARPLWDPAAALPAIEASLTSPNLPAPSNPTETTAVPAYHAASSHVKGGQTDSSDAPLDRYAKVFVPQWLRAVNEDSNYRFMPLDDSDQVGKVDFAAYAQTVWPPSLWQKLQSAQDSRLPQERQLSSTAGAWLAEDLNGVGELLEEGIEEEDTLSLSDYGRSSATLPTLISRSVECGESEKVAALLPSETEDKTTIPSLRPSTYFHHWNPLLEAEAETRRDHLSSHAVFAQTLQVYAKRGAAKWDPDSLYKLYLPGVREERPKLTPGDLCHLRPLVVDQNGYVSEAKGWLHVVFEARITAVRAIQGEIVLYCPHLPMLSSSFPAVTAAKFNVAFVYNATVLDNTTASVQALARASSTKGTSNASALRNWLFPSAKMLSSVVLPFPLEAQTDTHRFPVKWFDQSLNAEQKTAVLAIAGQAAHTIPFLLSGPPGTGKTLTSVEAVLQVLHRIPKARVLVVAPSNAASDVLAIRLSNHLSIGDMFRLNSPTRTFAEVPARLTPYTYVDDEKACFSLPPWKLLMKAKVIVAACQDVDMLNNSCVASNIDIARLQQHYLPGLKKGEDDEIELHWTHLLVDEAAQGTEPDLAPAFACVLPHPECTASPSIILVGDPAQLGPAIKNDMCRSQGLDISLLDRLSRLPVYAHSLGRLKRQGRSIVLSGVDKAGGATDDSSVPIAHCGHLIRNYRARHPALLHLPSTLFYSDSLVPCASASPRLLTLLSQWSALPRRGSLHGMPLLFKDVRTEEEWVDEGVSWWNQGEAQEIVRLCRSLVAPMKAGEQAIVQPSEIAVISPFREQVWRIRILLRKAGLGDVAVGPVEAYQGQETPIVILSPVRSRSRFLARDREAGQGLICESKRLNVALTRARELLIIVGNVDLLARHCEYWRRVIGHARRNGWLVAKGKGKADAVQTNGQAAGQQRGSSASASSLNGNVNVSVGEDGEETQEDGQQEEISALEAAEATISGSWWRRMAGDLLLAHGHLHDDQQGQNSMSQSMIASQGRHGLGRLAGRVATIALQGDEDDMGGQDEDESKDEADARY